MHQHSLESILMSMYEYFKSKFRITSICTVKNKFKYCSVQY